MFVLKISILPVLFICFCSVCGEDDPPSLEIYSLHIKSDIVSRFATTLVTSRIANRKNESLEAVFVARLPDEAFISNFSMEINDTIIYGNVKEKEAAKQQYDKAKKKGQSAGLVAKSPRKTNSFHISVNVAAYGKVTFNLSYQEILKRVHGAYKHVVNVQPGQVVRDLKVQVQITESKEIIKLLIPEFGEKTGENTNQDLLKLPPAENVNVDWVEFQGFSRVQIEYEPNSEEQNFQNGTVSGLNGQLVVLYDVERGEDGGELQVVNGYFVHFFAPKNLKSSFVQIIFVIDSSGSMSGRKMEQTKEAMEVILPQLKEGDKFNILDFDSQVITWKEEAVFATRTNIHEAVKFVNQIDADGGTNIYSGLELALNYSVNAPSYLVPIVILLTDGQPTEGVTNNNQILANVQKLNSLSEVSIQSIAFGAGADFNLLMKLSMQNHGIARKVYEDSDAPLQLQGFYSEISSLLLRDVKIEYMDENVTPDSIVQDNEYNYFDGSEFMVLGKLKDDQTNLEAQISAIPALGGETYFTANSEPVNTDNSVGNFVERMWAYLSIKKLLEKAKFDAKNSTETDELQNKALELSLKYNFVTELTSMVVTVDEETDALSDAPLKQKSSGGRSSGRGRSSFQASGDPHYRTADGYVFHPQHEGRHILMRTKQHKTSRQLASFEIIADNKCTKRLNTTCIVSYFGYAELHLYGKIINISSTGVYHLNGSQLSLPYSYTNNDRYLKIWHLGSDYIRARTDFGMELTVGVNNSYFRVNFPHILDYKGQIEGLLGGLDFDGNPYNDLRLPSGEVFNGSYIYDYVAEWMESEEDRLKLKGTKVHHYQCADKHKVKRYCDRYFTEESSPFKECFTGPYVPRRLQRLRKKFGIKHPKTMKRTKEFSRPGRQQRFQHEMHLYVQEYLESCRLDLCAMEKVDHYKSPQVACQFIQSFESACYKLKGGDPKFKLPNWRNARFCAKDCGDQNAEFVSCVHCQKTCSSHKTVKCEQAECLAGCQCKRGFVLDENKKKCVKFDHC